jgi:hypothetical protein
MSKTYIKTKNSKIRNNNTHPNEKIRNALDVFAI